MKYFFRYLFFFVVIVSGTSAFAQDTGRPIHVGVMLPLHNQDGDGRRMLEYYRGFLMAVEDLKAQGLSVDIHAWNVPQNEDVVKAVMDNDVSKCDVIFGPLYSNQVNPLSYFCKGGEIKLVIPFSISTNEVENNPMIFQIYQDPQTLCSSAIYAFLNRFSAAHPVFIDCNDPTSKKAAFTTGLRKKLREHDLYYSVTNLKSSSEDFDRAFSKKIQNVVVLNTGRSPELNATFDKLNAYLAENPNVKITLFGYTDWLMYTRYDEEKFYRFDTYIPSDFYYNPSDSKTMELEQRYRNAFKEDMQNAYPRFALVGYDQAQFFLRGIQKYGKQFTGYYMQNTYHSVQTPFKFNKTGKGGYVNQHFQLIHYKTDHQMESISY